METPIVPKRMNSNSIGDLWPFKGPPITTDLLIWWHAGQDLDTQAKIGLNSGAKMADVSALRRVLLWFGAI